MSGQCVVLSFPSRWSCAGLIWHCFGFQQQTAPGDILKENFIFIFIYFLYISKCNRPNVNTFINVRYILYAHWGQPYLHIAY